MKKKKGEVKTRRKNK